MPPPRKKGGGGNTTSLRAAPRNPRASNQAALAGAEQRVVQRELLRGRKPLEAGPRLDPQSGPEALDFVGVRVGEIFMGFPNR